MEGAIRIVLIHPNRLFREGLAYVLAQRQNIFTVTTYAETIEVLSEIHSLRPDVVLMAISLPGRDILKEVRQLLEASSTAKILIIGLSELETDVLACIEAGVAGYLLQEASIDELIHSIQVVATGEAFCSPRIASLLFSCIAAGARAKEQRQLSNLMRLTHREMEVVALIEKGLSNKEIAAYLHIELQTVKNHVHNILEKLQLASRREAARYVREQGYLGNIP